VIATALIIAHVADAGTGSVGQPQVEIAVEVPIHSGYAATIVDVVQTTDCRNIREMVLVGV
jgi:hypothetical protein